MNVWTDNSEFGKRRREEVMRGLDAWLRQYLKENPPPAPQAQLRPVSPPTQDESDDK